MRISELNLRGRKTQSGQSASTVKSSSFDVNKFEGLVNEKIKTSIKQELNRLFSKVEDAGKSLVENMSLKDLVKYKRSVSDCLKRAVDYMLKHQKSDYFDLRGHHNIFSIVNKVDKKVESMTEEMLDSQRGQLDIIKNVDEIRGLIMDLII